MILVFHTHCFWYGSLPNRNNNTQTNQKEVEDDDDIEKETLRTLIVSDIATTMNQYRQGHIVIGYESIQTRPYCD